MVILNDMPRIYKIIFTISIILTVIAAVLVVKPGLNLGVDFVGGSVIEVQFEGDRPVIEEMDTSLANLPFEVSVSPVGDKGFILRSVALSQDEHNSLTSILNTEFGASNPVEARFDSIGPTIGKELKNKSLIAIVVVLIAVCVYIAIVFRKMAGTLSPWAMGLAAIVALAHDILIPLGLFAYLGAYHGVEISAVFVAAILTILGYSVSDTVVIFDRARENIIRGLKVESFGQLVHISVMQTLTRSLVTAFTTLLSLVAIYIFGGESIKYFALALIVGIFLGAYSSIFIASPMLVFLSKKRR